MGAVSLRGHGPYSQRWPCQRHDPPAPASAIWAAIWHQRRVHLANISCSPVDHDSTTGPGAETLRCRGEGTAEIRRTSRYLLHAQRVARVLLNAPPSCRRRAAGCGTNAKRAPSRFPSPRPCAVWLQCLASSFSFLSLVFLRLTFLASGDRVSRTVRSVRRPRPPWSSWQELPLGLSRSEPLFILS
jgi:hypothetical protein